MCEGGQNCPAYFQVDFVTARPGVAETSEIKPVHGQQVTQSAQHHLAISQVCRHHAGN